jgi:hypothetical protein
MPTKADGERILAAHTTRLKQANSTLRELVGADHIYPDARRRVRNETIAEMRQSAEQANRDFGTWSREFRADAERRRSVGGEKSANDLTREMAREMQIGRLIATAQAQDARTGGVQVVDGKVVRNAAAHDLLSRAEQLYLDGNHGEAFAHATAAEALGAPAGSIARLAQDQLDMSDPVKREAIQDLALVDHAEAVWLLETSALLASALQTAATAAQELGDDGRAFLREAVRPSMLAKVAAVAAAGPGGQYVEPEGVLASSPAQKLEPTQRELDNQVDSRRERSAIVAPVGSRS